MTTAEARSEDSSWRAWLATAAALAVAYALYVGRGGPGVIPFAFLTLSIALVAAAVFARSRPRLPLRGRLGRILGFGLAVQVALLLVWPLTNPLNMSAPSAYLPFWLGMGTATIVLALPLFGIAREGPWRLLLLVGIHLAIGAWVISQVPEPFIDVWIMQADGVRALAEGVNPYLPIYPNIHGPDSPYYGPGLVVNGELTIGFPYPPLSLLLVLPGELLAGDPRYAHLVAVGLAALVMAAIRPGAIATGAALIYLFTPWTFMMVAGSWTEPLVVLMLALVVLAAVRAPWAIGLALGLLMGVKQYALVGLPLALLLLAPDPTTRWRIGWQSVLVAALITVPFALWDIGAFAWSAIGSLAVQAFRPDSLTYLAPLPGDWGPRLSVLAFVLLVPLAAFIYWRAPRTPAGFAASVALMLLVFFAFSRQGSTNYYVAVIGALCCSVAAVSEPSQPPRRMDEGHPPTLT
jgi:hypothetical protein